ncbi:TonB-dependent receptor [Sphingomonas bacterium]|uniref:TonB-dependent receptor n=1 Tax=Sphingomonas bacterium TaxID=1895847 RepID=UPI0020C72CC0|nr:TonB-dependent receptor [Sphingomonas bacterium]
MNKGTLLAGACLSASLLITGAACAQVAAPQDAAPVPRDAPDSAPDSASATRPATIGQDHGDGGLPDVIVTARRRAEDAQRVPGSLQVIGGNLLDQSYTVNTQQLSQLVPSLNYSSANPRNTAFTIRGLGSSVVAVSQSNDGLEPGVGFYVDQVYHARPATAAFDFSDIEQIEVLRGPQGTLFGKNTTTGAISVSSRLPTFKPEGEVEVSYGSYNFIQAKGAVSGPIVDDVLAFRVSAVSTRRDGVIRNVRTGENENAIGNQAVRGQLLFRPTANLTSRLIADFTSFDSTCCTQVYLRVGQSLRPAAKQFPALAAKFGYSPPSTDPYARLTDIDAQLNVKTNEGGISDITDWTVGPVTITNVAAWRWWNWDAANDRDYTGIPVQLVQHIPSRQDQYSEELRFASNGEHRITYVGGFYYFNQKITGEPLSTYGPAATDFLLNPVIAANGTQTNYPSNLLDGYGTDGHTDFTSRSYAAFGEANWHVVKRLTVTGGLRYTWEYKDGSYVTTVFGGATPTTTAQANAKLSILRPQAYTAHNADRSLSGRGNLSYQLTDGVLGYASYARGFKSGGINMSGLPLDAGNNPVLSTAVVRPERNTNYEVGIKTRLFDRHLIFNIDGFYTKVRDFQATIVDSSQTVALRGYLSNIPEVTVKGIEAEATALVFRGLSLRASLAYEDGRYSNYPAGPCPLELQTAATTACSLTGQQLASLPKFSFTVGADYAHPVTLFGNQGSVFLHADSNSRSGYNGDSSLSRYTYIYGYNVTNGSVGYRFGNGLELAVFARNLLDTNYIQNVTIQAGNSGLILGTPSDPRTIGGTVRFRY